MTSPAAQIIQQYVCPTLGVIMSNSACLAPLRELQTAVSNGTGLKNLNPTPWAFMLGKCMGWLAYAILTNNWFVFWGEFPGLLISCWLNLGAVKLMYSSHHQKETRRALVEFLVNAEREGHGKKKGSQQKQREQQQDNDNDVSKKAEIKKLFDDPVEFDSVCDGPDDQSEEIVFDIEENSKEIDYNDRTPSVAFAPQEILESFDQRQASPKHFAPRMSLQSMASTATGKSHTMKSLGSRVTNRAKTVRKWGEVVWNVTSQKTPASAPHEHLVMAVILLWASVFSAVGFYFHYDPAVIALGSESDNGRSAAVVAVMVIGLFSNIFQIFFFGAPLSTIGTVIKTRKSDSIHVPTMCMNTVNSAFWFSYSVSPQINDPFIYIMTGAGLIFGIIQIALWMVFPRSRKSPKAEKRGASFMSGVLSSEFLMKIIPDSEGFHVSELFHDRESIDDDSSEEGTEELSEDHLESAKQDVRGTA